MMKRLVHALLLSLLLGSVQAMAQTLSQKPQTELPAPSPDQEIETLKIDTNLVTVPVIASSRMGAYIADLKKEEFKVSEDGVPQEIAFLAAVNAPFHVVLMLDTSASTEEKLGQIQQAAIAFVDQLSAADKVKVVSFDNDVRDLNEFTSDKTILRGVIRRTHSGTGTMLYDAVRLSLNALRPINRRKAIVIFTDGVDWHSEQSTFESTIHDLDESGVIVYPIRFDTRADTERLARKQAEESGGVSLPTSEIIRQPPNGTTPTTFPSDEPFPVPQQKRGTLPIPSPQVIFGRRTTYPPNSSPNDPNSPDGRRLPGNRPDNQPPRDNRRQNDTISAMLDNLYLLADSYLGEIAARSGGQVYRADTVASLPRSFAAIADELRTQYLLGYYPTNKNHDGAYRKIQVKTSRKDIAVRARPGYRARNGG